MCHHRSWLKKMSTTGIEVEGVESPAAGLSKIVVGEGLVLRRCARKLTSMFVRLTLAKKKLVKSFVVAPNVRGWYQGYGGSSRSSHRLTTTKSKRENPWLRVTWDDLFTWRIGNF